MAILGAKRIFGYDFWRVAAKKTLLHTGSAKPVPFSIQIGRNTHILIPQYGTAGTRAGVGGGGGGWKEGGHCPPSHLMNLCFTTNLEASYNKLVPVIYGDSNGL